MSAAAAVEGGEAASRQRAPIALARATYKLVEALFDIPFYLETYPDVEESGADPIAHYLETGWREQRDPSPTFNTKEYLEANRDVRASGICPLVHYVTVGVLEGRAPHTAQRAAVRLPRRRGSPARNAINSAAPLAERVKPWLLPSPVRPLEGCVLAEAFAGLAARPPAGVVVSLSHDDYATVAGGVQACVSDEERALGEEGWAYFHLCPVQPLPALAEPTPGDKFLVQVRLNKGLLGAVSVSALVEELRRNRFGSRRLMVMHHLLGFAPELVADIAQAFAPHETIAWVHDFFTLCPSYALLRNNVAFCGAPDPDSKACGICVYGGAERKRHLERMERLFDELKPTVLAPSQTALKFWLGHGRLAHRSAKAMPHGTLAMESEVRPAGKAEEPHLRVGFVGFPSYHKGWHVFERLAIRHDQDSRYSFFHLGSARSTEPSSNIAFVEVVMDRGRRDFMVDAVVANDIDVVVNWSLCYETFSFTAHEAVAGGAFVLAPKWAGNIVAAISQKGVEQGLGLDTEQQLFDLFASGDVFEAVTRRRYGKFIAHAATARYLETAS